MDAARSAAQNQFSVMAGGDIKGVKRAPSRRLLITLTQYVLQRLRVDSWPISLTVRIPDRTVHAVEGTDREKCVRHRARCLRHRWCKSSGGKMGGKESNSV